jgi:hypothetical protein
MAEKKFGELMIKQTFIIGLFLVALCFILEPYRPNSIKITERDIINQHRILLQINQLSSNCFELIFNDGDKIIMDNNTFKKYNFKLYKKYDLNNHQVKDTFQKLLDFRYLI